MTKAERAEKVYRTLTAYLDRETLKYEHDDAERSLTLTLTGEDFPITVYFRVEAEYERTYIYSRLPFKTVEEKQLEMIMAVNDVNRVLAVGAFCMDAGNNTLSYESTELFTGLDGFNAAYAERLLMTPFSAVEKYNDKLFDLNKGYIGLSDFARSL